MVGAPGFDDVIAVVLAGYRASAQLQVLSSGEGGEQLGEHVQPSGGTVSNNAVVEYNLN